MPRLREGRELDPALVNGVDAAELTPLFDAVAVVRYRGGEAEFANSLGWYTLNPDGTIGEAEIVVPDISDGVEAFDRFRLGRVDAGEEVGLFVVQDGANLDGVDLSTGSVAFNDAGRLIHTAEDGTETAISRSDVLHTQERFNVANGEQVVSAPDGDGSTLIAFEDKASTEGSFDGDYNDGIFDLIFRNRGGTGDFDPGSQTNTTAVGLPDGGEVALEVTTAEQTQNGVAFVEGRITTPDLTGDEFNIAIVFDLSGSTTSFARDGSGNTLDLDGDGVADRVYEAEGAAIVELNSQFAATDFADSIALGIVRFDDRAFLDETTPTADDNGNGVVDVNEIVEDTSGLLGLTFYDVALQRAIEFFEGQDDVDTATNVVYFLSDGFPNGGDFRDELATLTDPDGIDARINAIGLGTGALKSLLDTVDTDGDAQIVLDLSELEIELTASPVDQATVDSVELFVNGLLRRTIDGEDLNETPFGLTFETTVTGLDPSPGTDNDLTTRVNFGEDDDIAFAFVELTSVVIGDPTGMA